MGIVKRGVHDVNEVNDYSVDQPVESSGEKQEDIDMRPYKGYSPITRFAQDKPERKGPNLKIFGLIGVVLIIAIILAVIFLNKEGISKGGLGQQNLDMKIKNAQLEGDSAKINLEIDPKEENIVGIKFIFETEEGIEEFTQNISINESSEMEFTFKLLTKDLSSVKKISVVPILGVLNQENTEEKEEVFGDVKDTYVPKPRDIQEVHTQNTAQNTTSESASPPATNLENKDVEINNNQTDASNSSSAGSASGGLVSPVTSSTNTTGVTNQTTTMNYTNATVIINNQITPPVLNDSDDETDDEEDESEVSTLTTNPALDNTTDVPKILLQDETQVREFIISSIEGSTLSVCDKTRILTVIKQETSWKVYCLTVSSSYCYFILNNYGGVIVPPQCSTTTTVTTNTIDYKQICEDKGGIWVETYDSSSGAAYCRLPIITNN